MATPPPRSTHQVNFDISPNEADMALCSTSIGGGGGLLSNMVLREYGYDLKDLGSLSLRGGFALLQKEKLKPILFIVTTGIGNAASNLEKYLDEALRENIRVLTGKKVWVPLMGTGSGGLSFEYSYNIISHTFQYLQEITFGTDIQFMVAIPKEKEGEELFNRIQKEQEEDQQKTSREGNLESLLDLDEGKTASVEGLNIETKGGNTPSKKQQESFSKAPGEYLDNIFIVKGDWSGKDNSAQYLANGYWEYTNEIDFDDEINAILKDDFVFMTLGIGTLTEVIAMGQVVNNPKDGIRLDIFWQKINDGFEIYPFVQGRTFLYPDPIERAQINDLEFFNDLLINPHWNDYIIPDEPIKHTTTLAGLLSDSDAGADFLNIAKDVNAFARVIAAKSFTPPLAFGLFGKWGSGKSFFMRKLMEQIQQLSSQNAQNAFCEGIAHVHFNAWSYMDSNLWASMVSRIFEGLQQYISNDTADSDEKAKIEKTLTQSLSITQQELRELEQEQQNIEQQLSLLQKEKSALQKQLEETQKNLRTETLDSFLLQMENEFDVSGKVTQAIEENQSFIQNKEQFRSIIPDTYWNNPVDLYERVQSNQTFLRSFFLPSKRKENIIWLIIVIVLVIGVPLIMESIVSSIESLNINFPSEVWALISVVGGLYVNGIRTYNKLQPMVASFWKLKEDYNDKKQEAISSFEEQQRAYHAQIEAYKAQMTSLNLRIQNTQERKKDLEFRLKNTLSTEALYSFIERRSQSKDYKKHLGIISTIRKDFEILSSLFTGHHEEIDENGSSSVFLEHFNKPLERIVLYIDDLDRCPENRVVEVLEAVNLLMAFPLFIVVVGVDPRWVKNALIQKHQLQFGSENEKHGYQVISPSGYLEKIFQVPFNLKAANDDSVRFMLKKLVVNTSEEKLSNIDEENDDDIKISNDEENGKADGVSAMELSSNSKGISVTPTKLNVIAPEVTIEELQFSENETELLQTMSTVLGPNPRSIKRFTNIFRIIKAHADFPRNLSDNELLAMMFLIAFPIGEYRALYPDFCRYITNDSIGVNVLMYLDNEHGSIGQENESIRLEFLDALQVANHRILELDQTLFNRHLKLAQRFHFSG